MCGGEDSVAGRIVVLPSGGIRGRGNVWHGHQAMPGLLEVTHANDLISNQGRIPFLQSATAINFYDRHVHRSHT